MTVHVHPTAGISHDHELIGGDTTHEHLPRLGVTMWPGKRYRVTYATQKGNGQWWVMEVTAVYSDVRQRGMGSPAIIMHGDTRFGTFAIEVRYILEIEMRAPDAKIKRPTNVRRMPADEVAARRASGRMS